MAEELKIIITADDKASPVLAKTKGNLGGLGDILGKGVKVAAGAALGGVTALAGGLAYLGVQTVQGNAKFEEYNTQFEVLLGSADAAKTRMAALAEFGKVTPFELSQVVEADRILQSFGFHSVEAAQKFGKSGEQIRTIAGDVASGTGASFSEISLLLGKFASGATGEAIMRFQELGITTREEMSKMGLEFSKSGELLSPLPQAMTTVLQIMDGKYGGLMDKQSKTFSGMMSNLQDWLNGTIREVGRPVFEALSKQLDKLLVFLSSPEMKAAMNAVSNWLASELPKAIALATGAIELFTTKGTNLKTMLTTLNAWATSGETQSTLTGIGQTIGRDIGTGIREYFADSKNAQSIAGQIAIMLREVGVALVPILRESGISISQGILQGLIEGLTGAKMTEGMSASVRNILGHLRAQILGPEAILNFIRIGQDIGNTILGALFGPEVVQRNLSAANAAMNSFLQSALGRLGINVGNINFTGVTGGNVRGYASGGIVPGPLGMPQLAVVHGGETVTPAGGGGSWTFVYAPQMSLASESEITNVLTPALDRWYRNAQRRRVVG